MVDLRDVQTGLVMARITEEQLQLMIDTLEEEHRHDRDYHLDAGTLDHLASHGADDELLDALRRALDGRTEIELEWARRDRPSGE